MSLKTKNLLSTLAVLAAASAPAHAEQLSSELLEVAQRTANAVSSCPATADDLVSEVTLRLLLRHRDVLERGNFGSYVDASIRNAWRDHLRRKRTASFSDLPGEDPDTIPEPTIPAPDEAASTAVLDEFRGSLSSADREVLDHLEAGHADRQIAAEMSRTRHWVRTSVQRIRRQARRWFGDRVPA